MKQVPSKADEELRQMAPARRLQRNPIRWRMETGTTRSEGARI